MPRTRNDPPRAGRIDTRLAMRAGAPADGEVVCVGWAGRIVGDELGEPDPVGADVHAPTRVTTTIVAHATRVSGWRRILGTTLRAIGVQVDRPRAGRQYVVRVTTTVSFTGVGPPDVIVIGHR